MKKKTKKRRGKKRVSKRLSHSLKIKREKRKFVRFLLIVIVLLTGLFVAILYSDDVVNYVSDFWYSSNSFHDFESNEVGSFPEGFRGTKWEGTKVIEWENSSESYGNVAEVMDRDGRGVEFALRFKKAQEGVVEFDIYADGSERINIDICQTDDEYDTDDDVCIRIDPDDAVFVKDRVGNLVEVSPFSRDTWYHFKIEFNLDSWKLWINDVHMGKFNDFNYEDSPNYFCNLYFATYIFRNKFYVDNVRIDVIQTI